MDKKKLGKSLLQTFAQILIFFAIITAIGLLFTGAYHLVKWIITWLDTLTTKQAWWIVGSVITLSIIGYRWGCNYDDYDSNTKFWDNMF